MISETVMIHNLAIFLMMFLIYEIVVKERLRALFLIFLPFIHAYSIIFATFIFIYAFFSSKRAKIIAIAALALIVSQYFLFMWVAPLATSQYRSIYYTEITQVLSKLNLDYLASSVTISSTTPTATPPQEQPLITKPVETAKPIAPQTPITLPSSTTRINPLLFVGLIGIFIIGTILLSLPVLIKKIWQRDSFVISLLSLSALLCYMAIIANDTSRFRYAPMIAIFLIPLLAYKPKTTILFKGLILVGILLVIATPTLSTAYNFLVTTSPHIEYATTFTKENNISPLCSTIDIPLSSYKTFKLDDLSICANDYLLIDGKIICDSNPDCKVGIVDEISTFLMQWKNRRWEHDFLATELNPNILQRNKIYDSRIVSIWS